MLSNVQILLSERLGYAQSALRSCSLSTQTTLSERTDILILPPEKKGRIYHVISGSVFTHLFRDASASN
jgi:hypothetical protein